MVVYFLCGSVIYASVHLRKKYIVCLLKILKQPKSCIAFGVKNAVAVKTTETIGLNTRRICPVLHGSIFFVR